MIHWAFLIPIFIVGFAAGYAFLYGIAKLEGQIDTAIERTFNPYNLKGANINAQPLESRKGRSFKENENEERHTHSGGR